MNTIEKGNALRSRVQELGRTGEQFGLEARLVFSDGASKWIEELARLQDARFDYAAVNMMGAGLTGPHQHLAALEEFAQVMGLSEADTSS